MLRIETTSSGRRDYILHPPTGEQLTKNAELAVQRLRATRQDTTDLQIVISDGLNSFAITDDEHLAPYLREVRKHRLASPGGAEWLAVEAHYRARGVKNGPMHYPTHSTSGPISVMATYPVKVCAWGYAHRGGDDYYADYAFSNETALFQMANGATMRIIEAREIGHPGREIFRVYGTEGSFENDTWTDNSVTSELSVSEMRDPLPDDVVMAFREVTGAENFYGGHGGSHAYLVHEFVDAIAHDRSPAINVWESVRYMAAGAMAHKSALAGGVVMDVPDWGEAGT